ncbi:MAG: hypothetical protein K5751_13420, partial [Treponemataceae bacterium]|nr:hypothetical protein [Treponemataceae bacterium]
MNNAPTAFVGKVSSLESVSKGIFHLVVEVSDVSSLGCDVRGAQEASLANSTKLAGVTSDAGCLAKPGQFYMLKAVPSEVLLSRPISVYKVESGLANSGVAATNASGATVANSCTTGTTSSSSTDSSATEAVSGASADSSTTSVSGAVAKTDFCAGQPAAPAASPKIHFLIMEKGQGTKELCALRPGDSVSVIGVLGNTFPEPDGFSAIIGGGIGVAPVAGFAATLTEKTYDFYACFRSGTYGLEGLNPKSLEITTNDGSVGTKGMLPDVFSSETIKSRGYKTVYACGPEPMLAYVQKVCGESGVKCYLSMEAHMACGVGACLGCT